jgi:hypothetical protein
VLHAVRAQAAPLEEVCAAWAAAAGPRVAADARVRGYRGGVLRVEVRVPALLGELSVFRRPALEAALGEALPGFRELKVVAGAWTDDGPAANRAGQERGPINHATRER